MQKNRSPWAWIPTLYLAEGLPYVAVMTISVILYKRMGISNTDIALYTSWLYLPWVIKPFWSPFVDLLKTKRWWIVSMQLLIGAGFGGIAFTIPVDFFFQATLAFFWLLAFSSATHDIAADGFYMLALNSNDQAKFVGIRSTFYRIATIVGQGFLIMLAGVLESATGMEPLKINVEVSPEYANVSTLFDAPQEIVPQTGDLHFVTNAQTVRMGVGGINQDSARFFLKEIERLNREHGFVAEASDISEAVSTKQTWWSAHIAQSLGAWIQRNFGEKREADELNPLAGNMAVVTVWLSKCPDSDKQIVLNTTLNRGDKSIALVHGERLTFHATNWDKPAYLVFQSDPKLMGATTAEFKGLSGNIPLAWSVTFLVLAGLFIVFSFYHRVFLPVPDSDMPSSQLTTASVWRDFSDTFVSFFKKPGVGAAIFFMLTFRFSESQALKLITPFLLDSRDVGGLGLTTGQVGFVYGTVGILALTIGGIIGGITASRGGLKKWLWPMTLSVLVPTAVFVYLSFTQTGNMWIINTLVFIEQFGYGFGFTAYMLYLMYFSEGKQKTAHYAICTGFMALGMMLPGMFAGWMQEMLGYNHFFIWVMICSIVPIIAVSLLKIDPAYGKAVEK